MPELRLLKMLVRGEVMKVTLLNHTPNPDETVALAARTCHTSKPPIGELQEDDIDRLINLLLDLGHESPLEHVSFTFAIEGVSRALSHQLVRHRIASYSQKSQRYVNHKNFSYITPPSIKNNPEALAIFEKCMKDIANVYRQLSGVVPLEDARYVLPNACETSLVCTFNARSLLNFFKLRLCKKAQWEIRELAHTMLYLARSVSPRLFASAGPDCVSCQERSC